MKKPSGGGAQAALRRKTMHTKIIRLQAPARREWRAGELEILIKTQATMVVELRALREEETHE